MDLGFGFRVSLSRQIASGHGGRFGWNCAHSAETGST